MQNDAALDVACSKHVQCLDALLDHDAAALFCSHAWIPYPQIGCTDSTLYCLQMVNHREPLIPEPPMSRLQQIGADDLLHLDEQYALCSNNQPVSQLCDGFVAISFQQSHDAALHNSNGSHQMTCAEFDDTAFGDLLEHHTFEDVDAFEYANFSCGDHEDISSADLCGGVCQPFI